MIQAHLYGSLMDHLTGSMVVVGCMEVDSHGVDTMYYDGTTDCVLDVLDIPYNCNNPF